jgi:hypothetical protein
MKKFLGVSVVTVCVLLPLASVAQDQRYDDDRHPNQGYGLSQDRWQGRLSAEDQGRFDSYYSHWLNYVQSNDRDNRNSMEDRMRNVMSHYSIPSDVPFDQIASKRSQEYGVHQRSDREGETDDRGRRGDRNRQWQNRMPVKDQQHFNSYYSRWQKAREAGDGRQSASMEERMRDLMVRNSIPADVQFSQIASGAADGYSRPIVPRFSGSDARDFRSYYSRWQEYKRTNNREQVASMEGRMRGVMAHHRVPSNASYEDVMAMLDGYGRP